MSIFPMKNDQKALEYNEYIQPIDFSDGHEPRDGERCHLTGETLPLELNMQETRWFILFGWCELCWYLRVSDCTKHEHAEIYTRITSL